MRTYRSKGLGEAGLDRAGLVRLKAEGDQAGDFRCRQMPTSRPPPISPRERVATCFAELKRNESEE